MNALIGRCPVCSEALRVTRLECDSCGTRVEGTFALGRFHSLTPEQLQFLETFVRVRGNIKDVERELGVSYPTARARLDAVIRALGFEVPSEDHQSERRKEILRELSEGKIEADDAVKLLEET
ncbi:MAG TPA: DUF2089 domain-containing protein [Candidatus Dormibacteraeota bacterium]|jgi:hypothetical protein|nr:DUF2089 domain-containing protein [Candidatus Dormibacteraeota bacterium]